MHRNDKQVVLKRALLTIAVTSAALMASVAHAAGMGKITVLSALGEPLRAELDVTASREELASLSARVAPAEAFRQANVDYAGILSSVRFVLDKRPDGQPFFRMESQRAINDPFIDLLVELSWSSGRLVREYAFLLDPPELVKSEALPPVSAPAALSPADTAGQIAEPPLEAAPTAKETLKRPGMAQEPRAEGESLSEKPQADARAVRPGDTLAKIAGETAAEGVTLDQMLVALFNSNRDAFIGGNMNRLRAGKILSIPDAGQAAALDRAEARKIVVAQSADFNAYRNSLAAAAAAQAPSEQATQQSASGKIAPRVEEKAPAAPAQDKLQVSRSDALGQAKSKFTEEDIVARDKALKEANSRIADLEKNLVALRKLAELKSQAAADAQKAAHAAKTAPSPAAESKIETLVPTAPTIAAAPPAAAVSATAAAPVAEDKPKPKPKPKKKFVPPPPPPEPSFIADNPLLVYGAGVAFAALLGFLGFRTWKRKRDGDASHGITVSDLGTSSIFGATAREVPSPGAAPTDFGHSTIEAIDTSKEGVDPIQEAEVYMAYGRDGQAEEILLDAKRKDPTNLAVYLKLLEIYAGRKTLPQFNEVAGELHKRTETKGSEWDKASALGRAVDPTNPLYGGTSPEAPQSEEQALDVESAAVAEQKMDATMVMEVAPAQGAPAAAPVAEAETPAALDFDLDLTLPAAPEPSAEAPSAIEATTANDLDFDLGMDTAPAEESSVLPPTDKLDMNFDSAPASANSIDFDIAVPAAQEPSAAASDEVPAPASNSSAGDANAEPALDFDFDFELGETSAKPAEAPPSPPLDLSAISLDLDEPAPAAAAESGGGESPEVATKLELAQAYEEMGDREGARELLEEVMAEGSPAQQESARAKLAQLA